MGRQYQNDMLKSLSALQADLKDKKISHEEFSFLLGLLLQNEIDNFVQYKIDDVIREENEDSISLMQYQRNRTIKHA